MTVPIAQAPNVETKISDREFDRKVLAQTADLIEAAMVDANVLDDIPHGAMLVLLPADDPGFSEEALDLGLKAVREGWNVYFKHLPATAAAEDAEDA
jgi:hypothetical protein